MPPHDPSIAPLLRTITYCVLSAAAGLFVGRHWQPVTAIQISEGVKAQDAGAKETTVIAHQPDSAAKVEGSTMNSSSPMDRLKALAWFKANGFPHMEIGIADYKGLKPEFIRFFDLSPTEQQLLLRSLENAKQQSVRNASESAKATSGPTPDDLIIEIPELPESGGKIYDELLKSFRETLGPERYSYFDLFSGRELDRKNDSYGTKRKKYEIHRTQDAKGHLEYSLKIQIWGLTDGETTTIKTGGDDFRWLANTYPEIAPLIPASFKTKPVR